jgi:hypothetical protein
MKLIQIAVAPLVLLAFYTKLSTPPPFANTSCSAPLCQCPALFVARCFAHQCTLCGNLGTVAGEPAACNGD